MVKKEYIELGAVLKHQRKMRGCGLSPEDDYWDYAVLAEDIESIPAADVVEVVRCKDCKRWMINTGIADSPNGHCFEHGICTNGHDFCSYGKRKEATP